VGTNETKLEVKLEQISEDLREIKQLLNGTNGIIVRVDRLEQSHSRLGWFTKTALGAAVCAILSLLVKLFVH